MEEDYGFRRGSQPHPLDVYPAPERRDIYANRLPSAPTDHTPAVEDYPRGWTVQQPWYHPEYPMPTQVRCILCASIHPYPRRGCEVKLALISLPTVSSP